MKPKKIIRAVDLDNKKIVYDGCMITVSGIVVNLMNPDPNTILIEDIAHGLANNCRWNGHTQKFWSIAQHCCLMYDSAPEGEGLKYLFHDAEEAYWGDIISPLKNLIKQSCPEIIENMEKLRNIIYDKFRIDHIDDGVHRLDYGWLLWEFKNIIKKSDAEFWLPEKAKKEWLNRYNKI